MGEPLLAQAGRGRVLTPAGEELLVHARRILEVHRDAWLSLKGAKADGRLTLGCTQDFADSNLPDLLRLFARTHPRVRLDLRVGRSRELTVGYDQGAIDVLIVMRDGAQPDEIAMLSEPMLWLSASADPVPAGGEAADRGTGSALRVSLGGHQCARRRRPCLSYRGDQSEPFRVACCGPQRHRDHGTDRAICRRGGRRRAPSLVAGVAESGVQPAAQAEGGQGSLQSRDASRRRIAEREQQTLMLSWGPTAATFARSCRHRRSV